MDKVVIRKVVKEDLPAILAIYKQPGIDDKEILDITSAEVIFNRFQSYPNYNLYVAILEGKIVGSFELLIMDNLAHNGSPSGIVEDVVVDYNYRGYGIGKRMMNFAMEECKKSECYKLMLSSSLKRKEAHKFYENLGFENHGYSFLITL